jgi:hypothetical protein
MTFAHTQLKTAPIAAKTGDKTASQSHVMTANSRNTRFGCGVIRKYGFTVL